MKKLFVLLMLLGVASSVFADTMDWLSSSTDRNWFSVGNWRWGAGGVNPTTVPDLTATGGSVRTYQSGASVYGPDITTGQNALAYYIKIGGSAANAIIADMTLDGGTLTVANYIMAGSDSSSIRSGKLIMNSGIVNIGTVGSTSSTNGMLYVGGGTSGGTAGISGWLNMIGGTINALGDLTFGRYVNANGYANISGGTIYANDLKMKPSGGNGIVSMDITGSGKVIINGDKTANIAAFISNGWLTGNGNDYDIMYDYNITTLGKTTIFVPEPTTICLIGMGLLGLIRRK